MVTDQRSILPCLKCYISLCQWILVYGCIFVNKLLKQVKNLWRLNISCLPLIWVHLLVILHNTKSMAPHHICRWQVIVMLVLVCISAYPGVCMSWDCFDFWSYNRVCLCAHACKMQETDCLLPTRFMPLAACFIYWRDLNYYFKWPLNKSQGQPKAYFNSRHLLQEIH